MNKERREGGLKRTGKEKQDDNSEEKCEQTNEDVTQNIKLTDEGNLNRPVHGQSIVKRRTTWNEK